MKTANLISITIPLIFQFGCAFHTPPAHENQLAELRSQIDHIDAELVQLVGARLQAAKEIGLIKKELGKSVIDPAREVQVVERFTRLAGQNGVPKETATSLIKSLIAASRAQQ